MDINGNKSVPFLLEALPLPNVLIESVDVGFDTTTVLIKNLAPLFVLRANNPAFEETALYLAYQRSNSPNSLIQKVLITPSLEETLKVSIKNLAPNTEYNF